MSILGEQIKELREAARQFEGYQNGEISRMMCEAAYTIESLRDRLQAATLGSEREAKLIRAMEDVLRHATDTVWVSEIETLVDRMVSLGVYGCEVYEGARPWEVD